MTALKQNSFSADDKSIGSCDFDLKFWFRWLLSWLQLKPYALSLFCRYSFFLISLLLLSNCSGPGTWLFEDSGLFSDSVGCKIQTYINADVASYIRSRDHSDRLARTLILPFEVPENFAKSGNELTPFGHQLARRFQQQLLQSGKFPIIEFQDYHWQGKREEFFSGNFDAIRVAREAGFDFVMVGFLGDVQNENELTVYTKLIDVTGEFTVWHARTIAKSHARGLRRTFASAYIIKNRPDIFSLPQETEKLISCTTSAMLDSKNNSPG